MQNNIDLSSGQTSPVPDGQYIVRQTRNLTSALYVLRFDRNNLSFQPGQYITLGLYGDHQVREYSVYSTADQPFLEVLIRVIERGLLSGKLQRVKTGDLLKVGGPFGSFTLDEKMMHKNKYLFIATGTGIAPFHSIAGSYPGLDYQILHGVRYAEEACDREFFPPGRYILCTSRDSRGDFRGRVTDYLNTHKTDSDTLVYLCGNSSMIYEAYDLLTSSGVKADQIKTEVYF
jgi:ferredoxin/flavodoxin---NADP+ reductase